MNVFIYCVLFLGLSLLENWSYQIDEDTGNKNGKDVPFMTLFMWAAFGVALYHTARL